MEAVDERLIQFVPPKHLLIDLKRAFHRAGIPLESVETTQDGWLLKGGKGENSVEVYLSTKNQVVPLLRVFGPIPVSKLKAVIHGTKEFVRRFKYSLDVSLLRCLG